MIMRMRESAAGLREFCKLLPPESVGIELGAYAGDGTQIFLDSGRIKRLYCVDTWEPGWDERDAASATDLSEAHMAHLARIGSDPRVVRCWHSTDEVARWPFAEPIDFVYIDACHEYESVCRDIWNYTGKVRSGGFIAGHDYGTARVRLLLAVMRAIPALFRVRRLAYMVGVTQAVQDTIGTPEYTFADCSWASRVVHAHKEGEASNDCPEDYYCLFGTDGHIHTYA
jgi:hypothetical protein